MNDSFQNEYNNPFLKFLNRARALYLKIIEPFDLSLLIGMLILIIIGMTFIFSALMFSEETNNAFYHVSSQLRTVGIGGIMMVVFMIVPITWYQNKLIIYGLNIILVIILIRTLMTADVIGGSRNWLDVGSISFQPSEFSKIALTFMLANYMDYGSRQTIQILKNIPNQKNHYRDFKILLKDLSQIYEPILMAIILLTTTLVLIQMPDIGMLMMILGTLVGLLAINYLRNKFLIIGMGILVLLYFLLRLIANLVGSQLVASGNYQWARLGIFVNPFIDELDKGYQLIQSMLAFSEGGWFGKGIGQGLTKQNSLPAAHTDFITAIIGEEVGFVGMTIILVLIFGLYFYALGKISQIQNSYHRNIALSMIIMLILQSIINIGGAISLIPLTGVTLPFISFGGTSIIVSMIAMGIIHRMLFEQGKSTYLKNQQVAEEESMNGI